MNSDRTGLMKAHGIIMIFTWMLFVSTGVLFARYFKSSWPEQKVCGEPIWFTFHRLLMTMVTLLTITAFILIFAYKEGVWVSKDNKIEYVHSIIGIIVICFAIIQPLIAVFRCKPNGQYRFIFNYLHATIGLTSLILSVVVIFLAVFFSRFGFNVNKEWGILIGWTCWLFIIFVIFTIIECCFKKNLSNEERISSHPLKDMNNNGSLGYQNELSPIKNNFQQDRIKTFFLFIHILVALGLALALSILIGET